MSKNQRKLERIILDLEELREEIGFQAGKEVIIQKAINELVKMREHPLKDQLE